MKVVSKHLAYTSLCVFSFLSFLDCSSKISLWKERERPIDSNPDRGTVEILLQNEENLKVEATNIMLFMHIYEGDSIKKYKDHPLDFQYHRGVLLVNEPYEFKVAPGEYFASALGGYIKGERDDLLFKFKVLFGYDYDLTKKEDQIYLTNFNASDCITPKHTEHRCAKIIVKKDQKTKIIIRAQKDTLVESGFTIGQLQGGFPFPQRIGRRETPEVLIEVQNPK
ncbi:hypothetical protein AB3N61_14790 [Leptospira sp. WS58.C1]|uniref:hypothetical protein n=1 Tax=Leptospira cinconiae TaxID=3235173 RepID=UPI00349EC88C